MSANAVTALFRTPYCARRVVRVAAIIAKPKPDEMPRNAAASGAASRYGRTPAGSRLVQPGSAVAAGGVMRLLLYPRAARTFAVTAGSGNLPTPEGRQPIVI